MIFIDASAIVAVICRERDSERLILCLGEGGPFCTSAIAVYEAAVSVSRATNSTVDEALVDVLELLMRAKAEIAPVDADHAGTAVQAFGRFGKGRHPAKLNMGDCFAYAAAKARNAKILFVGDDFVHTDLESALPAS
jgi:ribonuclease VapC